MAKEPDSLVLRLLRDIRETQQSHGEMLQQHGAALDRLGKRMEDLYKIFALSGFGLPMRVKQ